MLGIISYRTVYGIVNGRDSAHFAILSGAEIPFPATAHGPLILQGSSLHFALRFELPVTAAQIGTPMASLTIDSHIPRGAAMIIEGHLEVCTNNHIRNRFAANLRHVEQYHIMKLKCQTARWEGCNSRGIYDFR